MRGCEGARPLRPAYCSLSLTSQSGVGILRSFARSKWSASSGLSATCLPKALVAQGADPWLLALVGWDGGPAFLGTPATSGHSQHKRVLDTRTPHTAPSTHVPRHTTVRERPEGTAGPQRLLVVPNFIMPTTHIIPPTPQAVFERHEQLGEVNSSSAAAEIRQLGPTFFVTGASSDSP